MSIVALRSDETFSEDEDTMRLRETDVFLPGRNDVLPAKPWKLKIEQDYNVRDLTTPDALKELDELEASVAEHGIQTPLKVRFDGEHVYVVEGHRRLTVVKRLIAKYKATRGAEGRNIQSVPVISEPKGTTPLDRDFALKHSNSGEKLKPLEFASLIFRTIQRHGISEAEAAKGFGVTMDMLKYHLALRGELPDRVKQQVNAGDIAPNTALKVVREARDAKNDPEFAAELIRRNKEENERLGVNKKKGGKVTAKTLKRDKPKPAGQTAMPPEPPNPALDRTQEVGQEHLESEVLCGKSEPQAQVTDDRTASETVPDQALIDSTRAQVEESNGWHPDAEAAEQPRSAIAELFQAIKPFVDAVNLWDLNAVSDEDDVPIEITGEQAKKLSRLYAERTGGDV